MPIYEYECMGCGARSETWQKLSDAALTECASCRGKLRKLISQNSFHLKGGGWYVTDYAARKGGGEGKKESVEGSGGKSAAGASDKKESKSAEKA
jgi:putative FmdB family regulatory protein